jgi:hypothetical protein
MFATVRAEIDVVVIPIIHALDAEEARIPDAPVAGVANTLTTQI